MLRFLLVLYLFLLSQPAFAEPPLALENILPNKSAFTINVSLSYANQEQQSVIGDSSPLPPISPNSFVPAQTTTNADIFTLTTSLHYVLFADIELYLSLSQLHSETRTNQTIQKEDRFAGSWLGANYRISPDNETPALLGFFEVALQEVDPAHKNVSNAKSFALGLTTYRSIDPIVLSLGAAYQYHLLRDRGIQRYQPGNFLILSPSVGFTVNELVTLSSGFQLQIKSPDILDGKKQGLTC